METKQPMEYDLASTGLCDTYKLFPEADKQIKGKPCGIVSVCAGFPGGYIKSECYGVVDDPLEVVGCKMFLVKFLDGSAVVVRYSESDYVSYK